MIEAIAILLAIGIETWLSHKQAKEQTAYLQAIWVELARQRLPAIRRGVPSVLTGRALGYEQPTTGQKASEH